MSFEVRLSLTADLEELGHKAHLGVEIVPDGERSHLVTLNIKLVRNPD